MTHRLSAMSVPFLALRATRACLCRKRAAKPEIVTLIGRCWSRPSRIREPDCRESERQESAEHASARVGAILLSNDGKDDAWRCRASCEAEGRRAAGRSVAPPHAAGQYQFRVKI